MFYINGLAMYKSIHTHCYSFGLANQYHAQLLMMEICKAYYI